MTVFVDIPEQLTWVDGSVQRSHGPSVGTLHDANTGAWLADSASSSVAQVEAALAAASRAHRSGTWWRAGVAGRAGYLRRWADELDARAERIARLDAVETGVPLTVTTAFAQSLGDTVRTAVEHAEALGDDEEVPSEQGGVRLHHVPWGPAALICPWNAPAALAVKKAAYALAAGAPAVIKPSEFAPLSTQLVLEAATAAGLPDGVLQLVLGGGDVGGQLCADARVRAISMTGSTPTGRNIATRAGRHLTRLRLELGSNNPAVVLDDADPAAAAQIIVDGAMKLSGQWCEAPRRVLAPRQLLGRVADALWDRIAALEWAPSTAPACQIGPVAYRGRLEALEQQRQALEAAGGRVRAREGRPGEGWFFAPSLVVGDAPDPAGEMFGPLLTLQPYDDEDEALRLANSGLVGLAGYVLTGDEDRGRAFGVMLEAGEVKVNGSSLLDMAPGSVQSFFGASGIGGHGDADLLRFFVGSRIVGGDRPGLPI
ncbi:MAG TPA: aldehyde dehydrogenase [Ornithinicoccus sp.]|nr:aldehyde dehydrogenase [Ornithinicoccus sp.]